MQIVSNRALNEHLLYMAGVLEGITIEHDHIPILALAERANPIVDVEKPPLQRSGDIEVFSPEEVWALVRAAGSERDGEHWTGDDDLMFAGEGGDPASRRVEIARHTMGQCSSARCQGC